MQRSSPNALATLAASALAFALIALGEWATLTHLEGARVQALLFTLGLSLALSAPLIIGLGLFLPPLLRQARPGAFLLSYAWPWTARATPAAARSRVAAALTALSGGAGLIAAAAFMGGRLAHGFANPALTGPFTALLTLGGLALAALLTPGLYSAARWLYSRLLPAGHLIGVPSPALPLLIIGAAALFIGLRIGQLDLGSYRYGGYLAVSLGVVLSVALSLLTYRLPRALNLALLALLLLTGGGALWATLNGFEAAPIAARAVAQEGHMGAVGLKVGRALLDFDRDGAAGLLGGGDCAEGDPAIGPHAKEIPGNGIDDNCRGGDAPKLEDAPKPPASAPASAPVAEPEAPKWSPKRLNVVMLVLDTVRYDHLGVYGYARPNSPNIDAWAKDAVLFERVYAQAPNTPRSFPSIFTGRYPSRVSWVKRFDRFSSLKPENQSIFEIFQAGGWHTEAISSHWYWEKSGNIKDGVDRWDNEGFLTIKESNTQISSEIIAGRTVERLKALSAQDKPFMLFVHFFDPHSRYMHHKEFKVYEEDLKTKKIKKVGLKEKYDTEIAYTDHHIARIFEQLQALNMYEDTLIMVYSDHGESFGEHHHNYFHGRTVYDEELRVPMLIRMPGVAAKREPRTIALIDILPTLAEIVGLSAPEAQGISFAPLLHGIGEYPQARDIYLEQLPYPGYEKHIMGLLRGDIKVIRNITDNVNMVFNLKDDPKENKNLLDQDKKAGETLFQKLDAFIDSDPGE
ncbi:sulfatase [Myxococcota bacterium]|nr:sulfatase [Myxococcota bacterium]MBU1897290.1 sulfatase [Myxococcota bacterium]